ncbi:hypothetical protein BKA64DRAFT_699552 [Cadophora sp. MPI-SDFR-AT-0126]|nr:hypothetical protein BKA64DRAFT_699552 [Leotiomycetes sp. MPI-SDFR-AT-0126]
MSNFEEHPLLPDEQSDLNSHLNSNSKTNSNIEISTISITSSADTSGEVESTMAISTHAVDSVSRATSNDSDTSNNTAEAKPADVPAKAESMSFIICSSDFTAIARPATSNTTGNHVATSAKIFNSSTPIEKQFTTFTLFPKLALGIRRLIWEAALPDGRLVSLRSCKPLVLAQDDEEDGEDDKGEVEDGEHGEDEEKKPEPQQINDDLYEPLYLPITLFINKESRKVTLNHYVVLPAVLGNASLKPIPYVFAPTRDIANTSFFFDMNFQSLYNWNEHCWLSGLSSSELSRCLDQVKNLRVEVAGTDKDFIKDMAHSLRLLKCRDSGHDGKDDEPWCCIFHKFSALETVTFIINSIANPSLGLRLDRKQFCVDVQETLVNHVTSFTSGLTPNFVLQIRDSSMQYIDKYDGGLTMQDLNERQEVINEERGLDIIRENDEIEDEDEDGNDDDEEDGDGDIWGSGEQSYGESVEEDLEEDLDDSFDEIFEESDEEGSEAVDEEIAENDLKNEDAGGDEERVREKSDNE